MVHGIMLVVLVLVLVQEVLPVETENEDDQSSRLIRFLLKTGYHDFDSYTYMCNWFLALPKLVKYLLHLTANKAERISRCLSPFSY